MIFSRRINFEAIRSIAFGSIGPTYVAIGSPIDHDAKVINFLNFTDVQLDFSLNGVDDMFSFPLGIGPFLFANELGGNLSNGVFPKGTQLFVKHGSAVPSTGDCYLIVGYTE